MNHAFGQSLLGNCTACKKDSGAQARRSAMWIMSVLNIVGKWRRRLPSRPVPISEASEHLVRLMRQPWLNQGPPRTSSRPAPIAIPLSIDASCTIFLRALPAASASSRVSYPEPLKSNAEASVNEIPLGDPRYRIVPIGAGSVIS